MRNGRMTRAASARPHALRRLAASIALAGLLAGAGVVVAATSASAEDYPTYADVQAAKADEAKLKAVVKQIQGRLNDLQAKVDAAQKKAQIAGDAAQVADQAYQEQALKTQELTSQADDAKTTADASKQQAAELAARLYREGPTDLSMSLFIGASDAAQTLYDYGMSEKLSQQWQGIYERAQQDENTASALSDQAKVAAGILQQYKQDADAKLAVANAAAEEAATALDEENAHKDELQALLVIAQTNVETTQADYEKGVEQRRLQQQAALQQGAADHGAVVNGWTNPGFGRITSRFGQRVYPFPGFHLGTDVGVACGGPEYAAHAGTVSYSGWNGIYGNFIRIDVGEGVQIEYGHIENGGLLVHVGDTVTAGQLISRAGATGGATGCHEHFGVRLNGLVTDPQIFLANRGITLGVG